MTIFAGAFDLSCSRSVPDSLIKSIKTNLRRKTDSFGTTNEFNGKHAFITKWDSGAFSEPAWIAQENGVVATLVGDPLLLVNGKAQVRANQLQQIISNEGSQLNLLAAARGTFAIVQYLPELSELRLTTDAIGLRPIYYSVYDGYLLFATALRIIEAVLQIKKTPCRQGVAELSLFSFPLADRTPYSDIKLLRETEILTANKGGIVIKQYHDWVNISAASNLSVDPQSAAHFLYEKFNESVRIRRGQDKTAYAFLSGGMDSRAIVTSLVDQQCEVNALNFSPDQSQDQKYAVEFARSAGAACQIHLWPRANDPNFSLLALEGKRQLEEQTKMHVDRPAVIWSGDGGSVGLGHVYMNDLMIDKSEVAQADQVIDCFLDANRIALPMRALTRRAKIETPHFVRQNIESEMLRYPSATLGRRLYLFLLFNDQRRHLFKHFETIDEHGIEFLTPFFDKEFLQSVISTPIRWGLYHRLYSRWFENFPAFARTTPWQTYPGHEACPIACDSSFSYQWQSRTEKYSPKLKERLAVSLDLVANSLSPSLPEMFSRSRLAATALAHALGFSDMRHVGQSLGVYRKYYR